MMISSARGFPDSVPILVDPATGVTLRAHDEADLSAIVEQARDPEMQRWTLVPIPEGGYALSDARDFAFGLIPAGWASGSSLGWAIEAEVDDVRRFCGSIDLRIHGDGLGEVGFGLHPAVRGRSVMSAALRLVRDYGFDACGLTAIRWLARVGNWGSRRVAAAAGFRFDGRVRKLLPHRGELVDGWQATITSDDPRSPLRWLDPPVLTGERVVLRPFADGDAPAIVEACSEERTQFWLISLPIPYDDHDAADFVEGTRELAAQGRGLSWCVADRVDDRCLGSVGLDGFGGYSRRSEIGYWTHPSSRGRGLMSEAVTLATSYAENANLVDSISIRCATTNTASRQVARAAGYHEVGVQPSSEPLRDGTLADLVLYCRP